ncbi:MAG: excinuclease ABC subunit UvrC [Alphaproteobacteria bacterium]|nr:MAG: excinuclease ABC subunit UvrC [Alphaproteobacteria bacterium]
MQTISVRDQHGKAEDRKAEQALAQLEGVGVIRRALKTAPKGPGVYRMLDAGKEVLYVGKAKSIRKRLAAYAAIGRLPIRLQRMVARTREVVFVTTESESEALLLEANLIKRFRPPFNIVLRDDKSFPHILIRTDHAFPAIAKHRGAQKAKGHYFGPYASAGAVNRTINTLQKAFLLRSCTDAEFESRSRPCLLHQIKRCSAPCVGRIGKDDYAALVDDAKRLLEGRARDLQLRLTEEMNAASQALDFERAATLRDRLRALNAVQAQQETGTRLKEADVFAIADRAGRSAIQAFFFRAGQHRGNAIFFPRHAPEEKPARIVSAFLAQFYRDHPPPKRIIVDLSPEGSELLTSALSRIAERRVAIEVPKRGPGRKAADAARRNAEEALARKLVEWTDGAEIRQRLAEIFGLSRPPGRIEVYDNSHLQGSQAFGAMIVAGAQGFERQAYRRFRIRDRGASPGDDYAMMREVMRRRFAARSGEGEDRHGERPDLLLIDGGRGQVSAVREVLIDLGLDDIPVIGIAKGPARNAGREEFHLADGRRLLLPERDPVLHYLQRLRDEAHRFVIAGHRARRLKAARRSALDAIPGIGPKRRRALIAHFGSARGVADASLAELARVPGISKAMARTIQEHLHGRE